ncbi:hypothetical protein DFJ58DRAFT_696584 [Suillus subalutaceus]|uniref:uncharacterized protein n=1 Tax=Suillus subalutaceus TaxID=48586 RepID=UPI001B878A7A|nr:uncharacterized protein DFJ58DRAFT_696584 [Suillus subalutaceus]KAG1872442.1 hypothetical protein DFJ58DRAFT_696584 [Suillus subalutaceus]
MKYGIYKSDLMQSGINDMWFANRIDKGIVYASYFDPLPVKLIALVLTVIECCIDEWATGVREDIKFAAVSYSPVYLVHLESLRRFEERTAAYKLLGKICDNLLDVARFHAGVNPINAGVTVEGFADDVFDDAMREYEFETQAARGEDSERVDVGDD